MPQLLTVDEILNGITDAIIVLDDRWRFIFINQKTEQVWDKSREELIGQVIWEVYPGIIDTIFCEKFTQAIIEQKPVHFEAESFFSKQWVEVNVFPKDEYLIIYFRDITNRKKVDAESTKEYELLSVTLRSIADGVIAIDNNGRVILMNHAASVLTGWSEEEAVGLSRKDVFYVIDDRTSEPIDIQQMVHDAGGHFHLKEAILVTKDLREIKISDSCAYMTTSDGEQIGMVIVFRDITERIKIESELQKAEKLESLGILAGGIAHDFNNTLTSVVASVQLAIMNLKNNPEIRKILDDTVDMTKKASHLTKQLLAFARGGAPIKKSASIKEVITDSVSFSLRGSNIKPEFSIPENLWPVEIDEGQISQVLNNLTINAMHAMPRGGTIAVRTDNCSFCDPSPVGPGDYIKIEIEDQGHGIPQEYLDNIFDPFFTTKTEGSGLGLTISYSIIKNHDGHIEVQSKEGEGTIFTLYIPAKQDEIIINQAIEEVAVTSQGKILVMDDQDTIRYVIGEMLANHGFEVTLAKNGNEAIEYYRQSMECNEPFDILLLDLTVPGDMGGQEAIAFLRDINPEVKAIVCSGYADNPVIKECERYGFCDMIVKPYGLDELMKVLHRVRSRA